MNATNYISATVNELVAENKKFTYVGYKYVLIKEARKFTKDFDEAALTKSSLKMLAHIVEEIELRLKILEKGISTEDYQETLDNYFSFYVKSILLIIYLLISLIISFTHISMRFITEHLATQL